ncbi:MAG: hypothetical protein ACYTGQ_15960, partial [Planctomycetota bacterium]
MLANLCAFVAVLGATSSASASFWESCDHVVLVQEVHSDIEFTGIVLSTQKAGGHTDCSRREFRLEERIELQPPMPPLVIAPNGDAVAPPPQVEPLNLESGARIAVNWTFINSRTPAGVENSAKWQPRTVTAADELTNAPGPAPGSCEAVVNVGNTYTEAGRAIEVTSVSDACSWLNGRKGAVKIESTRDVSGEQGLLLRVDISEPDP